MAVMGSNSLDIFDIPSESSKSQPDPPKIKTSLLLPKLKHGESDPTDLLHTARKLTPIKRPARQTTT